MEADVFVFASADSTAQLYDRIEDFALIEDRIDLSALDLHWLGTAAFDGSAGALRYARDGANSMLLADLDGDLTADFAINIWNGVALEARHLLL